jgi:phytoene synthase
MPPAPPPALAADYAHCLRLARHAENFPVASRLLPPPFRPHLAAVYAFARGADDLADEPAPRLGSRAVPPTPAARLAALDEWERALSGAPPPGAEPVFRALAATRAACALPLEPFLALLTAFRWDVERSGFPTWAELRRYADHSAVPVGRLVLALAGREDPGVLAGSDDLCVALQFTNFWQDLSVDWPRGRLYLPEESWSREELDRARLDAGRNGGPLDPARLDRASRAALGQGLAAALDRTGLLFARTRTLPERAGRPLDLYLAAVWEGGHAVLAEVRALGERAFALRPRLGILRRARTLWRAYRRVRLAR